MMVLMVSGLAAAHNHHFCASALGRSAHAFHGYFQALQQEPLNPVERVVISLVLTRAKALQDCRARLHG